MEIPRPVVIDRRWERVGTLGKNLPFFSPLDGGDLGLRAAFGL